MAMGHDAENSDWLVLCRPGSERDAAAELGDRCPGGYARLSEGQGWLSWHMPGQPLARLPGLVFGRSWWPLQHAFGPLSAADRITPLLQSLSSLPPFGQVRLEYADTNEGRSLQKFLRGFRKALEPALRKQGLLQKDNKRVLHCFFLDSCNGFFGIGTAQDAGPWENGIPHLRIPAAAPSRSAMKLEEAWLRLMTPEERASWLRSGLLAVDLGAAPGGWTWQLARKGMQVTAVDHGKLQPALLSEWPVSHVSGDAFTWRPSAPVHWLVCDVVDKPARTLALMEKWLQQGWTRAAIFNLKLPMKQRWRTVQQLLERLSGQVSSDRIRASQLYYDRDEVTVLVTPEGDL